MDFIKNTYKFLVVLMSVWLPGSSLAAASTVGINFPNIWETESRALGAIAAPATGARASLGNFRESKLILDLAIGRVQSAITADSLLVSTLLWTMQFEWEGTVLVPLRNALARLKLLKDATDLGGSCSDQVHRSVFFDPAVTYMMASNKTMQHAAEKARALKFAASAFVGNESLEDFHESGHGVVVPLGSGAAVTKAVNKFLSKVKHAKVFGDEAEEHGGHGVDSGDELGDDCSSSTVDIEAEFVATEQALEQLEDDIMAMLRGKVVTRTKTIVEKAPPPPPIVSVAAPVWPLSLPDAMARLEELEPELNMLMGVLAGATGGVTAAAKILEARARSKARTLGVELELYKEMSALLALIDGGLVDV